MRWMNQSPFAISNLILLEYFEENFQIMREIMKNSKTSYYLIEVVKAMKSLDNE